MWSVGAGPNHSISEDPCEGISEDKETQKTGKERKQEK